MRIAGPIILVLGILCTVIAFANFFLSMGRSDMPRLFWLGFIGLPLFFFGGVMSLYGFMGSWLRYQAGEAAPVASDTVNYLAHETKDAVRAVAKAIGEGVVEGMAGQGPPSGSGESKD